MEQEKQESANIASVEQAAAAKAEGERIKYEAVKCEIDEKQRAAEEMQERARSVLLTIVLYSVSESDLLD